MLQTTVLLLASIVSLHIVCLHGLPRLNYVQTFDQVTDIEDFTTLPGVNVVYYYQKGNDYSMHCALCSHYKQSIIDCLPT